MTESNVQSRQQERRRTGRSISRRWFFLAAAAPVVAGGALWARRGYVRRGIESELARVRAAGEPTTLAELQAFHDNAPNANALVTQTLRDAFAVVESDEFTAAAEKLPYVGSGDKDATTIGQAWPNRARSEQFLATFDGTLDGLHQCIAIDGTALLDQDFSDGGSMLLRNILSMRKLVRVLHLEAAAHAHKRNSHRAVVAIRSLSRLAGALADNPLHLVLIYRETIDGVAIGQTASLIPAIDVSDADLADLDADLRKIDYHAALPRVLAGERMLLIDAFEHPEHVGGHPLPLARMLFGASSLLDGLQLAARQARIVRLPFPQALREVQELDRNIQLMRDWSISDWSMRAVMLNALPSTAAMVTQAACADVRAKACRAQIAIERYFRKHGAVPARLDDLVPEFLDAPLVDPFDGGELRYAVDAQEIRIYSVGENGVDDGGTAGLPRPAPDDADYVIRFKRPVARP